MIRDIKKLIKDMKEQERKAEAERLNNELKKILEKIKTKENR